MATYRFECPYVVEGSMLSGPDVPYELKAIPWYATVSLIKRNGVFQEQRYPLGDELNQLEGGVDYFLGGYVYTGIPQEIADALTADGFGDGLTEE